MTHSDKEAAEQIAKGNQQAAEYLHKKDCAETAQFQSSYNYMTKQRH